MLNKFAVVCLIGICTTGIVKAGFDPSGFDYSVKPQDDFYKFVNGTWVKNNPVPPQYSRWASFDKLQVDVQDELHGICEDVSKGTDGSVVQKEVGDFYAAGMDEAAIDAAGITPLTPELNRINAVSSPAEVFAEMAHLAKLGIRSGFAFYAGADAENSDMNLAQLRQGGLGLPDRDYYVNADKDSVAKRTRYVTHVAVMFQLAGESAADATADAAATMRIETALATASRTRELLRDPHANYHKVATKDLPTYSGDLDWVSYFHDSGAPAFTLINLEQPEFIKAFGAELTSAPVADWKAYLRWRLLDQMAPYLSTPLVNEDFEFNGKFLTGAKVILPRWQRVVKVTDGEIGEALGQLYVAKYFPPEAKAKVLALVADLRASLAERIKALEWMDAPTKEKALAKLAAFSVKMGYPDKWRDYSSIPLSRASYAANVLATKAFEEHRELSKINQPVDRSEWGMTPQTVNAYYSPTVNGIAFPAGILQPPFFDPKADDAVNYGAIGSVIGHEMTHGFDDQGRQYDLHGNLKEWWSPESAALFKTHAAMIIKQFDGYTILDGVHVKGIRTQGENIADLGGVKTAYYALEKRLGDSPRTKLDGFTPEQRFFISFANVWRYNITPDAARLRVNTDPHSPNLFRANGPLSNLPEFYQAFDVPEGAPMRRSESERVIIW